jgi:hypothetical protein
MKTVFNSLVILLAASVFTFAQTGTLRIDKSIELNSESKTQYVEIDVPENATDLHISVYCRIKTGSVEAILLDPNGKSMGKIKLGSDDNETEQSEDGKLNLVFNNAQKGTWQIKVVPNKTEGRLSVGSTVRIDATKK